MSAVDAKATALNTLVAATVCATAYYILTAPRAPGAPPDDAWFQRAVISRSEPVLVKFGADWCGPCRMLDPELDQFSKKAQGRVAVIRVDVASHPDLARHYGVSSIPRLLLFRDGQVLADRVGYVDHQHLQDWVTSYARK